VSQVLNNSDMESLSKKSGTSKIESGDIYLRNYAVYRVSLYDDTKDRILFSTTNDIIHDQGWTSRKDMRDQGFHPCPLRLRSPAIDIFELEELSLHSLVELRRWRRRAQRIYNRFDLDSFIRIPETREFIIPDEIGHIRPQLRDRTIKLSIPFLCLTKAHYTILYRNRSPSSLVDKEKYKAGLSYKNWPVMYVPQRFGDV
jgi:hypothetical protein